MDNKNKTDKIYLCNKKRFGYDNCKWLNVDEKKNVSYLWQKIVGNDTTILLLMEKDIVVRELFKSITNDETIITNALRKCLIINNFLVTDVAKILK